jgi:hypothetical protein
MSVSPEETRRSCTDRRGEGCASLQVVSASTSVGLAVRPKGELDEEDTEAEHYRQSERCNHRSEECKRFRHP